MTEKEKEIFVCNLEEELLKGGVMLSDWATRISKEAINTFIAGHDLACLLTAMAAAETHLRSESLDNKAKLYLLIDDADLDDSLKTELHKLRKFRNRWVHVSEPWANEPFFGDSEKLDGELQEMSQRGLEAMMRVLFSAQWT